MHGLIPFCNTELKPGTLSRRDIYNDYKLWPFSEYIKTLSDIFSGQKKYYCNRTKKYKDKKIQN